LNHEPLIHAQADEGELQDTPEQKTLDGENRPEFLSSLSQHIQKEGK